MYALGSKSIFIINNGHENKATPQITTVNAISPWSNSKENEFQYNGFPLLINEAIRPLFNADIDHTAATHPTAFPFSRVWYMRGQRAAAAAAAAVPILHVAAINRARRKQNSSANITTRARRAILAGKYLCPTSVDETYGVGRVEYIYARAHTHSAL